MERGLCETGSLSLSLSRRGFPGITRGKWRKRSAAFGSEKRESNLKGGASKEERANCNGERGRQTLNSPLSGQCRLGCWVLKSTALPHFHARVRHVRARTSTHGFPCWEKKGWRLETSSRKEKEGGKSSCRREALCWELSSRAVNCAERIHEGKRGGVGGRGWQKVREKLTSVFAEVDGRAKRGKAWTKGRKEKEREKQRKEGKERKKERKKTDRLTKSATARWPSLAFDH